MDRDRFLKYVRIDSESSCWLWTGGSTRKGYGKCGHNYKTIDAHRMSYMLFTGPISPGKIIRHTCDVRKCVNPEHLIEGTYLDNMKDAKDRGRKIGRPVTHSDEEISDIHTLRSMGYLQREIAEIHGVSQGYVSAVLLGQIRADLKYS